MHILEEDADNTITYHYKFIFKNGEGKEFNILLNKKTLDLIPQTRESHPPWTELKYYKCQNCTLDDHKHKLCPIAVNIIDLIETFKSSLSFEEVDVLIETPERAYSKHVSLQKGLSSLLGIYMSTSGCPILARFKPLVRFHLPFSTIQETSYRVMSMYLLAQYFSSKQGKKPDWEFKDLAKFYENVQIVNRSFCKRLATVSTKDANLNAVVILNTFAEFISFSINKNMLKELEVLFSAYLE